MRFVISALFALLATSVDAKPLYVNGTTGNDATTYATNDEAHPWRTISRAAWGSADRNAPNAAEAARAGDTVLIAAGTYTTAGNLTGGGGGRQDVAYGTANSGTSGAPLRFVASGVVALTFSSGAGPMIGCTDRNYVEWSGSPTGGFLIDERQAPTRADTGPVTFFRATGCALEYATLLGNPAAPNRAGDNYNGVRLEDAVGTRIRHNTIRGYNAGGLNDRNHSGITTYRSTPFLIEHNLFEGNSSGIYVKGTSVAAAAAIQAATIRFNVFRGSHKGISFLQAPHTAAQPMLVAQNVFEGSTDAAIWIQPLDSAPGYAYNGKWLRIVNNTFVNNASAVATYIWTAGFPRESRFLTQNNIVSGNGNRVRQDTGDATAANYKDVHDFDRNVYATAQIEVGGGQRTWAYWQGLGQDTNSVIVTPGFVSGTDYRLHPASPARTVGRAVHGVGGTDGAVIPAGAYITGDEQIGPGGNTPTPTPVDCAGTWGAWTRQTGSEGACTNGSRTFLETRAFTVTQQPSGGGLACPASPEMRTQTEPCTVGAPLNVTASGSTRTCTLVAQANQAPGTETGWGVQFSRRLAGDELWTAHGARDAAAPYTRSAAVPLGDWEVQAVWTRAGVTVTVPALAVWACEP